MLYYVVKYLSSLAIASNLAAESDGKTPAAFAARFFFISSRAARSSSSWLRLTYKISVFIRLLHHIVQKYFEN